MIRERIKVSICSCGGLFLQSISSHLAISWMAWRTAFVFLAISSRFKLIRRRSCFLLRGGVSWATQSISMNLWSGVSALLGGAPPAPGSKMTFPMYPSFSHC